MATIDVKTARAFLAAVPRGRWTSYGDVAAAAGNPKAAQAIGQWLSRDGYRVRNVYRVLRADGHVAEGLAPAGPGVRGDEVEPRRILAAEGVRIGRDGYAAASQRFRVEDWPDRPAWTPRSP